MTGVRDTNKRGETYADSPDGFCVVFFRYRSLLQEGISTLSLSIAQNLRIFIRKQLVKTLIH
jgi:hypothetical protein